jgi:adenylate cyclase
MFKPNEISKFDFFHPARSVKRRRLERAKLLRANSSPEVLDSLDQLSVEALRTEKLRVIVLLSVVGALGILSFVPPTVMFEGVDARFRDNMNVFMYWRFVLLAGLLAYLVAQRLYVYYLTRTKQKIPASYPYLTAFVETSAPTVGVMLAASFAGADSPFPLIPAFIYPVFIVLSALRLNFKLSFFTGAVACVEYILVSYFYLPASNVFRPIHIAVAVTCLLIGIVNGFVAMEIRKRIMQANNITEERNNIVRMFGRHVSPAVVNEILARGADVRSEKKSVCIMFLDIRNFTSFAEKRTPEEVVYYLEHLFDFMIEIVNRNHGIINKFLGDGFMAVFGAPISDGHDCSNAVNAAKQILMRLKIEVAQGNIPPTTVGIGLHAGDAVMGSIGSALRKEYTVIGDVVNLAARIEKLNKEFGSEFLLSEVVMNGVNGDELPEAVAMGAVQVRGREEPIQIYQAA